MTKNRQKQQYLLQYFKNKTKYIYALRNTTTYIIHIKINIVYHSITYGKIQCQKNYMYYKPNPCTLHTYKYNT